MAKMQNVYLDKNTKLWFFKAFLGRDENGVKIQKTKRGYPSQKEAKLAYDKYMLTHAFNKNLSAQSRTAQQITFKDYYSVRFTAWYEQQVKRQTYENAKFIFEKRLQFFYSFRIRDISNRDIEDWMLELSRTTTRNSRNQDQKATLSKSYINRILGHLKIVLDRAVKDGVIESNPVNDVSHLPRENRKVEFWELDEFQKVMNQIPEDSIQNKQRKLVFETLFYTGLRIGELLGLTWSNINFEKQQITVEKTLIYQDKKHWYLSTPKTKNAYRTIGIGKKLTGKLAEWKELQQRIGVFEYITQIDGTFTPPYSFSIWLKEAAKKANVKPIKLHALRHSHVSLLIEQNIQPLIIQERLGHANIQITLGTYGHLYAKSDEMVVTALDNLWGN